MRWKTKPKGPNRWRKWFAWYPIVIGDTWTLFEVVERKELFDGWDFYWQYREVER